MKINALNTFSPLYNSSINNNKKNFSFGFDYRDPSIDSQHKEFVPKLDKLVELAKQERTPEHIITAINLLDLALQFDSQNTEPYSGELNQSARTNIADLYNTAIVVLVGKPFNFFDGNNNFGYIIHRRPNVQNPKTAVIIENIKYLQEKLKACSAYRNYQRAIIAGETGEENHGQRL